VIFVLEEGKANRVLVRFSAAIFAERLWTVTFQACYQQARAKQVGKSSTQADASIQVL